MAILYVFTVNDPNDAGGFPPSVTESAWWTSITDYWTLNCLVDWQYNSKAVIIFSDQAALTAYISEYKLTDSGLIADIATWKAAHGVSYSSVYYTLTNADITPTPTPVVS